jgi:hypothetical protein
LGKQKKNALEVKLLRKFLICLESIYLYLINKSLRRIKFTLAIKKLTKVSNYWEIYNKIKEKMQNQSLKGTN